MTRAHARPATERIVVLTCMDARIDPLAALGLTLGQAYVLRNAGAAASDDVARSMALAHTALGVMRAVVMGHTDCAAHRDDDAAEAAVRTAMVALRRLDALPASFRLSGRLYDVRTGRMRVIGPVGSPSAQPPRLGAT